VRWDRRRILQSATRYPPRRESTLSDVTIKARENGPYLVTGAFTLTDADGTVYELPEGKAVALCRCGGSTNKPFCDSTHSKIAFEAAERAVAEADAD